MKIILNKYVASIDELKEHTYGAWSHGVVKIDEEFQELLEAIETNDFSEVGYEYCDCMGILIELWLKLNQGSLNTMTLVGELDLMMHHDIGEKTMFENLSDWIVAKGELSEMTVILTGESRKQISDLFESEDPILLLKKSLSRITALMKVITNITRLYLESDGISIEELFEEVMIKHDVTRGRFNLPPL